MSLLLKALKNGNVKEALLLLQKEEVRKTASENNNKALRYAALGLTNLSLTTQYACVEIIIELLKIKAVRNNAAACENEALRYAAKSNHVVIVFELLKIKTVHDNAAAWENEALYNAIEQSNIAVVIELLKINAVRDNAAAKENRALRLAAQDGNETVVIELLKIKTVHDNAAAKENETLYKAIERSEIAVVIELLKINAVRDNAAAEQNKALRLAADRNNAAVVIELLKIKAVRDNAAAEQNKALRLAAQHHNWFMFLKLLKIEVVRNGLALADHEVLREALDRSELGIASLIMDIYKEKKIPIPEELISQFNECSMRLSAKNISVESMVILVREIYEKNGTNLLDLFKDKNMQNCAASGENLALIFAARNGQTPVVLELIKIKTVYDRATVNYNEALRSAAQQGHLEIVEALLTLEPVRRCAAYKDNQALCHSFRFKHWLVAFQLLKVEAVKENYLPSGIHEYDNIMARQHEFLRMAVAAGEVNLVLLIMQAYKEKKISLPTYLDFIFSEGGDVILSGVRISRDNVFGSWLSSKYPKFRSYHTQNILTLEESFEKAYADTCLVLKKCPIDIINIVFQYASLPIKPVYNASTSPTLLLSGGPSAQDTSDIKKLMDNLQSLKAIMKDQIEKKEAFEDCLSEITKIVATNPKITSDMLVNDGKKLSSLIQEWFSDYQGLCGRLKIIFAAKQQQHRATA